jgi:pyruvate/2-oxoglutarate dehydrogenase complex dihydrolipoamide acyltransferase (E2) component
MRSPVHVPELRAGTVRLSLWFAQVGETLRRGERIAELLVDGATFDVTAPADGMLVERHARPDEVLRTGQVLGVMETHESVTGPG